MDKLGLSAEQLALIKTFFPADFNVYLFGSRVNGSWHTYSDLDICIKNTDKIDLTKLSFVREKFENSNLPFVVDIIDYHRCDANFQKLIDATARNLQELT